MIDIHAGIERLEPEGAGLSGRELGDRGAATRTGDRRGSGLSQLWLSATSFCSSPLNQRVNAGYGRVNSSRTIHDVPLSPGVRSVLSGLGPGKPLGRRRGRQATRRCQGGSAILVRLWMAGIPSAMRGAPDAGVPVDRGPGSGRGKLGREEGQQRHPGSARVAEAQLLVTAKKGERSGAKSDRPIRCAQICTICMAIASDRIESGARFDRPNPDVAVGSRSGLSLGNRLPGRPPADC